MSDTLDWNVAMIGKGHDLTQLIICGRYHRCAAVGRTRSRQGHQHFETSRRREVLSFEYLANVVSILF